MVYQNSYRFEKAFDSELKIFPDIPRLCRVIESIRRKLRRSVSFALNMQKSSGASALKAILTGSHQ